MSTNGPVRRRTTVAVLVAVTVLALVLLVRGPDEESRQLPKSGAATPNATRLAAGSGDEQSAVAAAVQYATASQEWLYLSDVDVEAAVRRMAAPAVASDLAADVVGDVRIAREGLAASPGRVWWVVRPLAWRADEFGTGRARVDVWVVTVLSAVEVAVPQAEWMTVTINLVWVDMTWRVETVRDVPGPTPMTGPGDEPWDAQPFDAQLGGFTRLTSETGR